ncbi:hypothetical protein [Idiomarina seosinensis]|uniref:Uncharacterized protein n=1 Tax=Idiomarina seosinensis TaxID=281739 RepID=A0A432ZH61_9GAMM|nr:hypothetical protein [Idiomarina seosinensis]RUO77269.1 hypothetical protein CWI81_01925 [Idiomarina seosinensis]
MPQQAGIVLLSTVLFSLLLSSAVTAVVGQRLEYDKLYADVVINSVINRQNLLRTLAQQLQRWPTELELMSYQQDQLISWSFDVVQQQPMIWQLPLARPQWQRRLIQRLGGQVVGNHWLITETQSIVAD